ncbi:hypothetical protein [Mycoplasma sp. 'Moose RK']|uniref:hypothetical protein n=1 Tax=Mycoplasma sp. 'Moose RK' TaxID=2780095 RepID=UPI0018C3366F|nr:hypothetical protein [Mycoplasma sp. 'Moose RK']MBG0730912.1 hypothetical protein [Mycoplasma sp. 'Moose RK']
MQISTLISDTSRKCVKIKQYKFTVEQEIKYIKIAESKGSKTAILHFTEEFREIYKSKSNSKIAQK